MRARLDRRKIFRCLSKKLQEKKSCRGAICGVKWNIIRLTILQRQQRLYCLVESSEIIKINFWNAFASQRLPSFDIHCISPANLQGMFHLRRLLIPQVVDTSKIKKYQLDQNRNYDASRKQIPVENEFQFDFIGHTCILQLVYNRLRDTITHNVWRFFNQKTSISCRWRRLNTSLEAG